MEPHTILVVSGDEGEARALAEIASGVGHVAVTGLADADAGCARLASGSAAIVDARTLPAADVERLVHEGAGAARPVPCLVGLCDPSIEATVDWMRRGAYAVVALPARAESLGGQIEQALRHRELSLRNAELERSLEAHQRLAMIGKLAAGVAHELNNPLDGVLRYVNLAVDKLPKDAPQVTYLHEARRGLRRMADIVRDLLQFSRNAATESTDEDAERLSRDAVTQVIAAHGRGREIEVTFAFPEGGIALPRGMFQVIGNLARNAVDAMPRGGSLRIAAAVADGRVLIDVEDTGTGIPEENRDRVFEPFFTTKEVGKGTGLGLPICQRIVERLGGRLSLPSEIGRGTTVHVDLPVRGAPVPQPDARGARPVEAHAHAVRAGGVF